MSFSKDVIVSSSAKLYNEDLFIKLIRSFIKMLNSIGPIPLILEELQKVVF